MIGRFYAYVVIRPQWLVGSVGVMTVAAAVLGSLLSRADADCSLSSSYAGTMTVLPDNVRPGQPFQVALPSPPSSSTLLLYRWSSGQFEGVYQLQSDDWTKLSDGSALPRLLDLNDDSPDATFSVRLPQDARPGRYRVCSAVAHACALMTITTQQVTY